MNTEEIMKLADAYAEAEVECVTMGHSGAEAARAALEAALSAKQEPYDKTEMNAFVQNLYDQKMREGKHGHYETMFHVVHQAIKRANPAPSVNAQLLEALKKIATVNAMDYEYQRWAKAAIAAVQSNASTHELNSANSLE